MSLVGLRERVGGAALLRVFENSAAISVLRVTSGLPTPLLYAVWSPVSAYVNFYSRPSRLTALGHDNWASVSEPHTCDFNATFSLYIYIYVTVTVLLKLRSINFDISFRILDAARAHCPDAHAERSAPPPPIVKATAHRGRAVNLRVACALAV